MLQDAEVSTPPLTMMIAREVVSTDMKIEHWPLDPIGSGSSMKGRPLIFPLRTLSGLPMLSV